LLHDAISVCPFTLLWLELSSLFDISFAFSLGLTVDSPGDKCGDNRIRNVSMLKSLYGREGQVSIRSKQFITLKGRLNLGLLTSWWSWKKATEPETLGIDEEYGVN
jgi:hypothetical protein